MHKVISGFGRYHFVCLSPSSDHQLFHLALANQFLFHVVSVLLIHQLTACSPAEVTTVASREAPSFQPHSQSHSIPCLKKNRCQNLLTFYHFAPNEKTYKKTGNCSLYVSITALQAGFMFSALTKSVTVLLVNSFPLLRRLFSYLVCTQAVRHSNTVFVPVLSAGCHVYTCSGGNHCHPSSLSPALLH